MPNLGERRAVAIVNPASGRLPAREKRALLSGWPGELTLVETSPDDDPAPWWDAIVRNDPDVILVGGGDGTVQQVASVLRRRERRTPIAHVPFGTANLLARALGFRGAPRDVLEALTRGIVTSFDVGHIVEDDLDFLLAASVGFPAEIIEDAPREQKNRLGFLAYLYAGLRNASLLVEPRTIEIRQDDEDPVHLESGALFVSNLFRFEDFGVRSPHQLAPEDGRLVLAAATNESLLDLAWLAGEIVAGHDRPSKRLWSSDFREAALKFRPACRVQVDGEDLGERTEISIRCLPAAVDLVVHPDYDPAPLADATSSR